MQVHITTVLKIHRGEFQEERISIIYSYMYIIPGNTQINWPSRSPDLSAPDYVLREYLKEWVYLNKRSTLEQLVENIRAEIRELKLKH